MEYKYISLYAIMDKILKHPMMSNLTYEALVDYTVDFMRIVGSPGVFEDKVVKLEVKKYKAALPDDFYNIIQVKYGDVFLRSTTDTFHLSEDKIIYDNEVIKDYTYKIQDGNIFTSIEKGTIEIAYSAIKTDEKGFPLIPDNSKFFRALVAYVKKEWFTILFDIGKISPQSLQNAQQEYAWAVGACDTEFQKMSIDKAESFYNSWRTLLLRNHQHDVGFYTNGAR